MWDNATDRGRPLTFPTGVESSEPLMPLAIGSRLGPYEILAPIGAGNTIAVDDLRLFRSFRKYEGPF